MITGNFILLDAARMNEAMEEAQRLNPAHESLYPKEDNVLLQSVAPYLFRFENESEFNHYFIEKGWGDNWGVMINSKASFDELHKHFRRFLMVKTEDGVQLFFRFYDPRVLRIFLPTCDFKQLQEFFGPVQSFLLEDEDFRYGIRFWLQNGSLQSKKIHFREISSSGINPTNADNETEPVESANIQQDTTTLFIPKQHHNETNSQTNNGTLKPNKPKWNMLD